MTEAEWLGCEEPDTLLMFLRGRASSRKNRLLGVAFCRCVSHLLFDWRARDAIEIAETYADGLASPEEMRTISEAVGDAYVTMPNPAPVNSEPPLSFKAKSVALQSTRFVTQDTDDYLLSCCRCTYLAMLRDGFLHTEPGEECDAYTTAPQVQCSLIHEIFGNPFRRPILADTLLAWGRGTIPMLAQGIYYERAFDRLPILADALEDAGCDNADILAHCRGPGPHVRGCWVVDLLLGKE
jgi:hypothetical protein